jgi:hypothetical protein
VFSHSSADRKNSETNAGRDVTTTYRVSRADCERCKSLAVGPVGQPRDLRERKVVRPLPGRQDVATTPFLPLSASKFWSCSSSSQAKFSTRIDMDTLRPYNSRLQRSCWPNFVAVRNNVKPPIYHTVTWGSHVNCVNVSPTRLLVPQRLSFNERIINGSWFIQSGGPTACGNCI